MAISIGNSRWWARAVPSADDGRFRRRGPLVDHHPHRPRRGDDFDSDSDSDFDPDPDPNRRVAPGPAPGGGPPARSRRPAGRSGRARRRGAAAGRRQTRVGLLVRRPDAPHRVRGQLRPRRSRPPAVQSRHVRPPRADGLPAVGAVRPPRPVLRRLRLLSGRLPGGAVGPEPGGLPSGGSAGLLRGERRLRRLPPARAGRLPPERLRRARRARTRRRTVLPRTRARGGAGGPDARHLRRRGRRYPRGGQPAPRRRRRPVAVDGRAGRPRRGRTGRRRRDPPVRRPALRLPVRSRRRRRHRQRLRPSGRLRAGLHRAVRHLRVRAGRRALPGRRGAPGAYYIPSGRTPESS